MEATAEACKCVVVAGSSRIVFQGGLGRQTGTGPNSGLDFLAIDLDLLTRRLGLMGLGGEKGVGEGEREMDMNLSNNMHPNKKGAQDETGRRDPERH